MSIIILTTGGRDFKDSFAKYLVRRTMDMLLLANESLLVVHGGCGDDADKNTGIYKGADGLVHKWAIDWNVKVVAFPAAWKKLGRKAGPLRNGRMLKEMKPQLVVAFSGNDGTANMVQQAQRAGVPIIQPR